MMANTVERGLTTEDLAQLFRSWAEARGYENVPLETILPEMRSRTDLVLEGRGRRLFVSASVAYEPTIRILLDLGGEAVLRLDRGTGHWVAEFGAVPIFLRAEEELDALFDVLAR